MRVLMCAALLQLCLRVALASAAASPNSARPWLDSTLPIPQRVKTLMAQMTIAEKAGQLLHGSLGLDPASPALQVRRASWQYKTVKRVLEYLSRYGIR